MNALRARPAKRFTGRSKAPFLEAVALNTARSARVQTAWLDCPHLRKDFRSSCFACFMSMIAKRAVCCLQSLPGPEGREGVCLTPSDSCAIGFDREGRVRAVAWARVYAVAFQSVVVSHWIWIYGWVLV